METEQKRIPFDWEKYQSGEYQVVCRDGSIPEQIVYYSNAVSKYKLVALVCGTLETFTEDGFWKQSKEESEYDLLLIPKPKKFQAWVNVYDTGAAVSWSNEDIAKQYEQWNNGFVKTILIEWEG
jgi:hypothetical protein